MSDTRFTDAEYGTLLEWYMVSDPWPLEASDDERMRQLLNEDAVARGHDDWVHAYHELNMEKAPQ